MIVLMERISPGLFGIGLGRADFNIHVLRAAKRIAANQKQADQDDDDRRHITPRITRGKRLPQKIAWLKLYP